MTNDVAATIRVMNAQMEEYKAKGWDKDKDGYLKYLALACLGCYRQGLQDGRAEGENHGKD